MTQAQFKLAFDLYLGGINQRETMRDLVHKSVKSGAIDISREHMHSKRLVKIVYHAILCEMSRRAKPVFEPDLIESENLQRFL